MSNEYHIFPHGCDDNDGSAAAPFQTISRAAAIARPGDVITIHEGVYREWVNPANGGEPGAPIIYRGAAGETAVITGAEIVRDWEKIEGSVWKAVVSNTLFGDFNPYVELIGGDWFDDGGRTHHRGEVYIDGRSLFEAATLDDVLDPKPWPAARDQDWSTYTWYCEAGADETTIWANFHEFDPAQHCIEINVRPFCFWPKETGRNYITVRNLTLKQAATQWAPPTALQAGLIGPNWSKGWVIEDNIISDSKCSGISLGKEKTTGHNEWTERGVKHGTQCEREVIFNALRIGWNKENIGSHVVRNNTIFNCEQTGICGHLGCVFSRIEGNHITNIHTKRLFKGAEVAGIKLHAPLDVVIEHNHIHNADRGIWMDWQCQGTRISRNLLYDNDTDDFFVEVSHGPFVFDNNFCLSHVNVRDMSQGGAFVHNLFAGKAVVRSIPNRFTPYHYPHETAVAGLMTIQNGDVRYYNDLYIAPAQEAPVADCDEVIPEGAFGGRVPDHVPAGTRIYDKCPAAGTEWWAGQKALADYDKHTFAAYIAANVYYGGAKPYKHEAGHIEAPDYRPEFRLVEEDDALYFEIEMDGSMAGHTTPLVTTELLGNALQTGSPYENADGTPLAVAVDFLGNRRGKENPTAGPLEALVEGRQRFRLWP